MLESEKKRSILKNLKNFDINSFRTYLFVTNGKVFESKFKDFQKLVESNQGVNNG